MLITRHDATGLLLIRLGSIRLAGARRGQAASDPASTRRIHAFAASELAIIGALCVWALILRLPFFFSRHDRLGRKHAHHHGAGYSRRVSALRQTLGQQAAARIRRVRGRHRDPGSVGRCDSLCRISLRRPDVVPRLPNLPPDRAGTAVRFCGRAGRGGHDVRAGAGAHDRASLRAGPVGCAAPAVQPPRQPAADYPRRPADRNSGDDPHQSRGAGLGGGPIRHRASAARSAGAIGRARLRLRGRRAAHRFHRRRSLSRVRPAAVVVRHGCPRRHRVFLQSPLRRQSVEAAPERVRHSSGRNDQVSGPGAGRAAVDRRPRRTPVLLRTLAPAPAPATSCHHRHRRVSGRCSYRWS